MEDQAKRRSKEKSDQETARKSIEGEKKSGGSGGGGGGGGAKGS